MSGFISALFSGSSLANVFKINMVFSLGFRVLQARRITRTNGTTGTVRVQKPTQW